MTSLGFLPDGFQNFLFFELHKYKITKLQKSTGSRKPLSKINEEESRVPKAPDVILKVSFNRASQKRILGSSVEGSNLANFVLEGSEFLPHF